MLTNLHPGMSVFENERGVCILRLHYDADPNKAGVGQPKTYVPEIKRELSPWALAQFKTCPSPSYFLQELEVEFEATQGEKVYFLYPEATLETSFSIPPDWTRYFVLDPHPGVPHAGLWAAVDPWGDVYCYRELWPSKIYGKKGNTPSDDNRVTPREFVEVMQWLESDENPENTHQGKATAERFQERIIDYAARGFGHTANDGADQSNYQERFEAAMLEFALDTPHFKDCIKQGDAGADVVNEWLKPREVDDGRNGWVRKSRLHIFQDRCPELILQLNSNRRQQLTPTQADKQDPTGKPIAKRNHLSDCTKYLLAAEPKYIPPMNTRSTWKPAAKGFSY